MNKAISIGLMAAAATLASCSQARGDAGPSVSRAYTVGSFDRIEVAGPYEVEVRTGADPSVRAEGPEQRIERMIVEVRGDELRIRSERQKGLDFSWGSGDKVRVLVTVPALREAAIAGSGGIRIDSVRGDRFNGRIAGSGDLRVDSVDVADLSIGVAGSGEAAVRQGRARSVKYAISGSGDIDSRGVQAETAQISIAGSGNVAGHASATANVKIAGSGDVEITGGARCSVSKQGSGNVRCS
ncbi:MAG TPA: head GIN domain-containing protein [Sphingomicrobium sp.]|nr:head GIN domain-containing protein [Sphingomicrobium sp.]